MGSENVTLLLIDDSEQIRQHVANTLQQAGIFTALVQAKDGVDALRCLQEHAIDLILCDVEMPRLDGFKFLLLKQSRPDLADIPLILLTGKEDIRAKIKGLEAGASDYLTKPVDGGELIARVKIHLKIKRLQDELREKNKYLVKLSEHDTLTNLYSRRWIMDYFTQELQRSIRYQQAFVVAMLDVDHFKKINGKYGHLAGDEVLRALASCMQGALRETDKIGRYGGEEFLFVLPHTDLEAGKMTLERIRKQIAANPILWQQQVLAVTVSIGMVVYSNKSSQTCEALLENADQALYRAKQAGRNQLVCV